MRKCLRRWLRVSQLLGAVTGVWNCMNAEREMEEERIICETWLDTQPSGQFAFARICGRTYFRPGYFDMGKDDWVVMN